MADQWLQTDPTLNRDDVLQYFLNTHTKNRVYGRTSGTLSDHIHLHFLNGTDSGLNLDPATGEISRDGNVLGDIFALAVVGIAAAAGGAVGVAEAGLSDTAKNIFESIGSGHPGWTRLSSRIGVVMALDLGSVTGLILKAIPEAQVAAIVDNFVDAEVAKGGAELKALIKTLLDKVYGTSIATVVSTSAQS